MDFSLSKAITQRSDNGKQDENTFSELQGTKLVVQIGERRTRDDASKAHLFGNNLQQAT
jgi:hypothetical protein